jgi:uncharacterized protein YfkK (UPF0435 family)
MKGFSERKERKKFNSSLFLRCGCQSEMLVLDYDPELDMVDISIYEILTSYKYRMSWWQKLRYIYQMLKHGQPYNDQIILNRTQIDQLKEYINSL